jgi:hypothetical protein
MQSYLNPNPDSYKKCVALRLGVIYDIQGTNRKQPLSPFAALLCLPGESYMTHTHARNTQKYQRKQVKALTFFIEKSPKT